MSHVAARPKRGKRGAVETTRSLADDRGVQSLSGARARAVLTCGVAIAVLSLTASCGAPEGHDVLDAGVSFDGAVALTDAGHPPDDATPPELDAGALDGGGADAEPTCPAIDCASLPGTTREGTITALDECAFGLTLERPLEEGEALADALIDRLVAGGLGAPRDLAHIRADLNREGRSGLGTTTATRLAGLDPRGFRWNTGDDAVDYWYPQGISGSADAELEGASLILVSWYHKTTERPTKGARLSLVDVSDPASPRYRHLLLVDPFEHGDGQVDFGPAAYDSGGALHAGGIAWIGDRIYVADTSRGLRIYDLSRAFAPSHADDTERIGVGSGRADAHGYGYAVPRVARYVRAPGTCAVRFSYVARGDADGEPALITGEYDSATPNGRLVAWPLDRTTGLLAGPRATGAVIGGHTRMQGGLRAGDVWYASSSSQDGSDGRLYFGRAGATTRSVAWVHGCEDLYLDASDRLWTVGEHPGRRDVVSIRRPRL
ncbi:MAG: hypothetical protein M3Y87_17040 [Myxococcota bacterium]|nr:hypothetical protein [Myxococcota bacterium]